MAKRRMYLRFIKNNGTRDVLGMVARTSSMGDLFSGWMSDALWHESPTNLSSTVRNSLEYFLSISRMKKISGSMRRGG